MRLCVFCGSSNGLNHAFAHAARALGAELARRGVGVVYGGGNVGLMGVLADAAMAAGGDVIGVIPGGLVAREIAHHGLTRLHVVKSMHERKSMMAELSDGFVALPGGIGTLEEFCEAVTWTQLGLHAKPCGLLNVAGFYDHLLAFFDHGFAEQFLRQTHRQIVVAESDPIALLDRLATWQPPVVARWLTPGEE